jgi:hypothetical protein
MCIQLGEFSAFFLQGVDEKNLDWLFPGVPDRDTVFDLTYRIIGFVRMLGPLRDYLCPRDPTASTLLRVTKELYSTRLSVTVGPGTPGFGDTR